MTELSIPEVYAVVAEWAVLNGADDLANKPGLWEGSLGEFHVSINGHDEDLKDSNGLTVPPMHIAVNATEYMFAVILVGPDGGIGAQDMEADVLAAFKADIAALDARDPQPAEGGER